MIKIYIYIYAKILINYVKIFNKKILIKTFTVKPHFSAF
jgi:hypothetical protein